MNELTAIFKTVLGISLFASIMIAAVFALKAAFKSRISIRTVTLLWLLVTVRLCLPVMMESPFHLESLLPEPSPAQEIIIQSPAAEINPEPVMAAEPVPLGETAAMPSPEAGENTSYSIESDKPQTTSFFQIIINKLKTVDLWGLAAAAWLAGAVIVFLISVEKSAAFAVHARKNSREAADESFFTSLTALKEKCGVKQRVRVSACAFINMPVVYGVLSPHILLPESMAERLEKAHMETILVHELCHIKNRDVLKNYAFLLGKALHWFNPLVWLAEKAMREDTELLCDRKVLSVLGDGQKGVYSQSLLEAARFVVQRKAPALTISLCENKSNLKKRVVHMLNPKRSLKSAALVSVIAAAVMIFGGFTTACMPAPEEATARNEAEEKSEEETNAPAESPAIMPEAGHISRTYNKGEITINIDADVSVPDLTRPAYVQRDRFTQEQLDKIIEVLFEGVPVYDDSVRTKSVIQQNINNITQSSDDLNSDLAQSNGIDNLDDLQKLAGEKIALLNEEMKTAPDKKPVIDKFDISQNEWLRGSADLGKDAVAQIYFATSSQESDHIDFINFGEPDSGFIRSVMSHACETLDLAAYSNDDFDKAKESALKMINDMGIEGFKLEAAYKSMDYTGGLYDGQEVWGVTSEREFYVFSFKRDTNSMEIDSFFYDGIQTNGAYDYIDSLYDNPMQYEDLDIWADGSGIVQFSWQSPVKTIRMADESGMHAMDVEKAIELMSQHAFAEYTDRFGGLADKVVIYIDSIQPSFARVKDEETDSYIIVPTWEFYGEIKLDISEANAASVGLTLENFEKDGDMYIISNQLKSIMSVTAQE